MVHFVLGTDEKCLVEDVGEVRIGLLMSGDVCDKYACSVIVAKEVVDDLLLSCISLCEFFLSSFDASVEVISLLE